MSPFTNLKFIISRESFRPLSQLSLCPHAFAPEVRPRLNDLAITVLKAIDPEAQVLASI